MSVRIRLVNESLLGLVRTGRSKDPIWSTTTGRTGPQNISS